MYLDASGRFARKVTSITSMRPGKVIEAIVYLKILNGLWVEIAPWFP
jgi:hypothetical protein